MRTLLLITCSNHTPISIDWTLNRISTFTIRLWIFFFWCVFISFVLVSLHLLCSPRQKKSHAVYLSNTLFRIVRFQSIEIENFVEILFGQIHRTLFYLRHDCRITHREKERGKKPQYLFMKTIFTMQINTENRS